MNWPSTFEAIIAGAVLLFIGYAARTLQRVSEASRQTTEVAKEALRQAQAALRRVDDEHEQRHKLELKVERLNERTSPLRRTGEWMIPQEGGK